MTRKTARALAVQLLYSSEMTGKSPEETLETFFEPEHYASLTAEGDTFCEIPAQKQLDYITAVLKSATEHREELDGHIARCATGWRLERISAAVSAILRCAMCEIMFMDDVPTGVAVNEAVDLAKEYGEDGAAGFVNGVLGAFARGEAQSAE
ncbi:MAG: transcription antitermination factor NusB [Oscillospiraceae bacterium]|nr:transcription antitermination factor NusB [Oscillospiraceae bacterium]